MPNKKDENFEINCISGFHNPIQFFGVRTVIDEPEGADSSEFNRSNVHEDQGKPPGAVSLSIIEIQDVICEGPISGLVEGEYINAGVLGEIGYTSSIFSRYVPTNPNSSFLRSMYYNDTEVIDESNRKNFQAVNVAQAKGAPGGEILSVSETGEEKHDNLEIVKNVGGERLRGPDSRFKNDGHYSDTEIKPRQDRQGRDNAKFYQITNKNVKGFRVNIKVNTLSKTETTGPYEGKAKVGRGDVKATTIKYKIDYRPVFRVKSKNQSFRKEDGTWLSFDPTDEIKLYGKISSGYIKTTSISLKDLSVLNDPDLIGWEIMIYRSTLESFVSSLRNQSFVDSIVEVYEESFAYPNTAVIKHRFRADTFSEIPARSFRARLLKVKVPNNYNPILRTYGSTRGGSSVTNGGDPLLDNYYGSDGVAHGGTTDIWNGDWKRNSDGTIKYEWTDNPAWVYFDLLTNARYGLGKVLTEKNIDKWTLFEIAKYCDVLVLGENDELEPRFSANVYINTQEDAYSVLNSFASIFRGISIYSGGQLKALSDKPQDAIYTFTNSNVVKGDFNYSSSSKKARNTVCLVRYNNKKDHYKPSVAWDEDAAGIQRYGIQTKELTAFGCTSKGQALRLARWTLASERLETQSVSFTAGIEASYLSAGDIIQISDRNRSDYQNYESRRKAGRTRSVKITGASNNYATIELDSSISGFINNPEIPNGSLFSFTLLTPPSYVDPFTANITGSSSTPFIKRSQVQKLAFFSNQVIHSGRSNFDSGNPESLVSIINFSPNGFAFENKLNTSGFNVTGFTGALYDSAGGLITQTGFVENPPDNFIWSIEYSGELKGRPLPDKELYKIISMEEREDLSFDIEAIEHKPEKYTLIESGYYSEKADLFPVAPTGINIEVRDINFTHSKIVEVTFFRGSKGLEDLGAYYIYYKTGADFIDADFPDFSTKNLTAEQPHFKGILNRELTVYKFLPAVSGEYHIRIYPVNFKGKSSNLNQYLGGTFKVGDLSDIILDYRINSLRADTETNNLNPNVEGKKDGAEKHFLGTDLAVAWQVGLPGDVNAAISEQISTRVTYRVPSLTNVPNGEILHEITGIDAGLFYHGLDLATRIGVSVPNAYPPTKSVSSDPVPQSNYHRQPLREYDIVVELVDLNNGKSSAGGTIIRDINNIVTTDSNYTNHKGYDILNLYSPAPQKITLTDKYATPTVVCATDSTFCSSQWVNPDGLIHFRIERDTKNLVLPAEEKTNNIASFAFLVSKEHFVPSTVIVAVAGMSGPLKNNILFNDDKSELCFSTTDLSSLDAMTKSSNSVLTSFMGASELYLSIASVDSLLLAAILRFPSKRNSILKLRFSNVVKIKSSVAGTAGALNFKGWAVIATDKNPLEYRSGGFASITSAVISGRPSTIFRFKEPMVDEKYEVIIYFRHKQRMTWSNHNTSVYTMTSLDESFPFGDEFSYAQLKTNPNGSNRGTVYGDPFPPDFKVIKKLDSFEVSVLVGKDVSATYQSIGLGPSHGDYDSMKQSLSYYQGKRIYSVSAWAGHFTFFVLRGELNYPIT